MMVRFHGAGHRRLGGTEQFAMKFFDKVSLLVMTTLYKLEREESKRVVVRSANAILSPDGN
jgi:hypothetical protein